MHIIYAVTTCSDRVYQQLFSQVKVKPAFQSQKYHRLLIEGLAAAAKVDVVANPPVNRSVLSAKFVRLPREEEGGASYRYIPAIRNPIVKAAAVGLGTFFQTLFLIRRDSAVIVDGLNRVTALSALLAARLRGKPCVGIVTDLPDMLGGSHFSKEFANFVIRHCTHYVFLTEAMNGYLNKNGKPYVILEGHSDVTMKEKILGYLVGPFGILALVAIVNQLMELYYTEIFYIDEIFGAGSYLLMSWVTNQNVDTKHIEDDILQLMSHFIE